MLSFCAQKKKAQLRSRPTLGHWTCGVITLPAVEQRWIRKTKDHILILCMMKLTHTNPSYLPSITSLVELIRLLEPIVIISYKRARARVFAPAMRLASVGSTFFHATRGSHSRPLGMGTLAAACGMTFHQNGCEPTVIHLVEIARPCTVIWSGGVGDAKRKSFILNEMLFSVRMTDALHNLYLWINDCIASFRPDAGASF
jgi:hypothetical protein